jgi:hypothetical protein
MTVSLFTIPFEIRSQIYVQVFRGQRLRWMRGIYTHDRYCSCPYGENSCISKWGSLYADCVGIRLASKQCHEETKALFFNEVQLNVTGLIDPDYGTFNSIIDITLLCKVHLDTIPGLRHPNQIIDAMTNIKSLHLSIGAGAWDEEMDVISSDSGKRLELLNSFSEGSFLSLSGSGEGPFCDFYLYTRDVHSVWERHKKRFELIGEFTIERMEGDGLDYDMAVRITSSYSSATWIHQLTGYNRG